jgi:hypothetical protein
MLRKGISMGHTPKKKYIFQDGKSYKLVEAKKEISKKRLEESFDRGKELGLLSRAWFDKIPEIDDRQVLRFNLDPTEYKRGYKEGFTNGS